MLTADSETISAFKVMAGDAKKRQLLVKDPTCMGGLVLVLSNQDNAVVKTALETLLLLAEDLETRPAVSTCLGIMSQLEAILEKTSCDEQIQALTDKLYQLLTENETPIPTPLKDSSNTQRSRSAGGKNRNLMGGSRGTKSVVLQIRGVQDQADRDLCMRLLLRVKGVVSVTFDATKKRCLLRVRPDVKPEALVRAISKSLTMTAQQVIRHENGDESLVSFNVSGCHLGDGSGPVKEKENASTVDALPPYLSDDEEEKPTSEEDRSAVARTDSGSNTASKWLNAAASFLTNSFYW